jgi:hypothetical protein
MFQVVQLDERDKTIEDEMYNSSAYSFRNLPLH